MIRAAAAVVLAAVAGTVVAPSPVADGTPFREGGALEVSLNGWSVDPMIPLSTRPVLGTGPKFTVRDGVLGDLLVATVLRYDREVEGISSLADEGSYNRRQVRGEEHDWSDHASGTAVDVNTSCRPLGSPAAATMTPGQVAATRAIVDATGGAVEWGGDYDDPTRGGEAGARPDPMHFGIAPGVTEDRARRALVAFGGVAPRGIVGQRSAPGCRGATR